MAKVRAAARHHYDPLGSPVIQFGIVFFFVAVIVLVAYVAKYYSF